MTQLILNFDENAFAWYDIFFLHLQAGNDFVSDDKIW